MKIFNTVTLLLELAVDYTIDGVLKNLIGEQKGFKKFVTRIGSLIISAAAGDLVMRQGFRMVASALPDNSDAEEDHSDEAPYEVDKEVE